VMSKIAPYGTWKSPIGADLLTQKSIAIAEIFVDPVNGDIYHSESRPDEGGRIVVVRSKQGKDAFGPEWNARSGVHEYGGSASVAFGGKIFFTDWKTKRVYVIHGEGSPEPVTPGNNLSRSLLIH
ncbi:hypothetical protein CPB86DRAFT_704996, partial [Serendipita vermifera]